MVFRSATSAPFPCTTARKKSRPLRTADGQYSNTASAPPGTSPAQSSPAWNRWRSCPRHHSARTSGTASGRWRNFIKIRNNGILAAALLPKKSLRHAFPYMRLPGMVLRRYICLCIRYSEFRVTDEVQASLQCKTVIITQTDGAPEHTFHAFRTVCRKKSRNSTCYWAEVISLYPIYQ